MTPQLWMQVAANLRQLASPSARLISATLQLSRLSVMMTTYCAGYALHMHLLRLLCTIIMCY